MVYYLLIYFVKYHTTLIFFLFKFFYKWCHLHGIGKDQLNAAFFVWNFKQPQRNQVQINVLYRVTPDMTSSTKQTKIILRI